MLHRAPGADRHGDAASAVPAPVRGRLARGRDLAGRELHRLSQTCTDHDEQTRTPTTMRTTPPFRADHVGSLLRPPSLLAARDDFAAGTIGAEHLRAVEDAAIADAVTMQADAGLQSATDGEFRRASWHMDFIYQLGGIEKAPGNLAVKFRNAVREHRVHPGGAARRQQDQAGPHDLRRRLPLPPVDRLRRRRPSSRSPRQTWCTIAAVPLPSTTMCTRTWRSSGRICRPRTPTRCSAWPRSAARTCSSTTRAWLTSTTRRSAPRSPSAARTPSTCTCATSSQVNDAIAGRPRDHGR